MKTKFEYAIDFTLGWEVGRDKTGAIKEDGGYNNDDGSPTKWGIRQAANPGIDVALLSKDAAITIYRTKYYDSYSLDKYELGLCCAMFDTGVNCGPGRMKSWYSKVEKTKDPAKRLIEMRDAHYFNLVSMDRAKYGKFIKGWTARTADLKKYIDIIRIEAAPRINHTDQGASSS